MSVPTITFALDGQPVTVPGGATIWQAARQAGTEIPVLCHNPRLEPVGVCRVCMVEVQGARTLVPACVRQVEPGMVVSTHSDRVRNARKAVVELLLADHPVPCAKHRAFRSCELELLAEQLGANPRAYPPTRTWPDGGNGPNLPGDLSSPVIAVDHSACILCDQCIRGCDWLQHNDVIGRTGKGFAARISFDTDRPMGDSTCVACGECAAVCPTGALTHRPLVLPVVPEEVREVDSVCPYCGVGCATTMWVQQGQVVRVEGRDGPANHERLCVKGRYGFDYSRHPQRLTVPLIRREEYYPKRAFTDRGADGGDYRRKRRGGPPVDYPQLLPAFREATWEEALDLAGRRLRQIKQQHGPRALAALGTAKASNEDNYLLQKFVRAALGSNNVDHCARLCHSSSVAALTECLGSGAGTNPFSDVEQADVCVVIGSNTIENHPVAATFIKDAAVKGTTLVVMDPRRPGLASHAHHYVRFHPGTDVALLNGLMHVVLREALEDRDFIRSRTANFHALRKVAAHYDPARVERITGVPAPLLEKIATLIGNADRTIFFWGMGIAQHTTGTDNARSLANLALLTGNLGRPGTGLHPLRGQNNVQGASDAGVLPNVYPGYQPVTDPAVREKFARAWGVALDPDPGLTTVEILHAALEGDVRGMLMMGENPFVSDPDLNRVRRCLEALEFLVIQDIYLTETAEFADVILPAASHAERTGSYTNTDRCIQLAHPAIAPPGQARADWEILCDLAARVGYPMRCASAAEIFAEMAALTPSHAGISHARLEEGPVFWPCPAPGHPGTPVLHARRFPRGRGKFIPAEFLPARELPDEAFPFVLNTGRVLEHWDTGTMSRRSRVLDELVPEPYVEICPEDAVRLGIRDAQPVRVTSRRGWIVAPARLTPRVSSGSVFVPFHFSEAAANLLTLDTLDPTARIPEYKYCAVRVEPAGEAVP